MITVGYTILMSVLLMVLVPAGWILAMFGRSYIWNRSTIRVFPAPDGRKRVLIHAASVGESGIAHAMAGEIKKHRDDVFICVTTSTETGLQLLQSKNGPDGNSPIDLACLAPFDHPLLTGIFVRRLKPDAFIIVETEIWPWLIRSIHSAGTPITIINGKLSRRGFRRYAYARGEMKRLLSKVSLICVQSRPFAWRFNTLGVPRERIEILGNVKFDSLPDPAEYDRVSLRTKFGIPEAALVFTAGSTRPGEEAVLISAFRQVRERYANAVMVLVPRHLNRVGEIEELLRNGNIEYVKRSDGGGRVTPEVPVLLLDTLGELIPMFACSDVAFVGGSLRDFGGHNPMEPAALGIPVLFGHYMEQTGSKELLQGGAAVVIHDDDELAESVCSLFGNSAEAGRMSSAGRDVIGRFTGTLERTYRCMVKRGLL